MLLQFAKPEAEGKSSSIMSIRRDPHVHPYFPQDLLSCNFVGKSLPSSYFHFTLLVLSNYSFGSSFSSFQNREIGNITYKVYALAKQ